MRKLALPTSFVLLLVANTLAGPFAPPAGQSGTTAIAAAQAGRNWVGYETSAEYVELAQARIAAALNGAPAKRPSKRKTKATANPTSEVE